MEANYHYAIKNQRGAWHQYSEVSTNQNSVSGEIWTNESGPVWACLTCYDLRPRFLLEKYQKSLLSLGRPTRRNFQILIENIG